MGNFKKTTVFLKFPIMFLESIRNNSYFIQNRTENEQK